MLHWAPHLLGPALHICISKESKKIKKSNDEEGRDKQKKVRLTIDNVKQDPFQFVSV